MTTQFALRGISRSHPGTTLLDAVDLTVRPGERVGIVGDNGSGKSTLLRIAAGVETADAGTVTRAADGGVGYLGQTLDLPAEAPVSRAVDEALAELRAMAARLRELESELASSDPGASEPAGSDPAAADPTSAGRLAEYGDLLTTFELRDGYGADARVDAALHGLGLPGLDRARPLGSLSGGERSRLALACLLAAGPELLLLDEPTNHLDAAALDWLEARLRAHPGTVIAVSHDRTFLTRVATAIVEVDQATLTRYGDGYAGYLTERAAARQRWEQAYARWCDEIRDLTEFAATTAHRVAPDREMKDRNKVAYDRDAGRVQSSVSGRVRNARERLRRLRADPVPEPPAPLHFAVGPRVSVGPGDAIGPIDGDAPRVAVGPGVADGPVEGEGAGTADGPVAVLRDIRVGDRLALDELVVPAGARILVGGPNGAGKSTLLRVLAGELVPDAGTVHAPGRTGHLPQDTEPADPTRSVLAAFAAGRAGTAEEHRDRLLSLGLFRPETLAVPVGGLSIGQRRRLALARLLVTGTDLLLLDEPTNHLAPGLVEELETALADYPGALVVVSHDRTLRDRFGGDRLELRDGRVTGYRRLARETA